MTIVFFGGIQGDGCGGWEAGNKKAASRLLTADC